MLEQIICAIICTTVQVKEPEVKNDVPVHQVQEAKPAPSIRRANPSPTPRRSAVPTNHSPAVVDRIRQHFGAESESAIELYFRESGLRPTAVNSSSGACGLVQALPCSKLPCTLANTTESIDCQLKWGRAYNDRRYGGTNKALAFWHENKWY